MNAPDDKNRFTADIGHEKSQGGCGRQTACGQWRDWPRSVAATPDRWRARSATISAIAPHGRTRERVSWVVHAFDGCGRGVLMVAALVCIAVVMMLAATLGKVVLMQHRQADLASCEQQSLWLAESAVERAIHNLQASPDYTGETWDVPADVLGSGSAGVVIIQVAQTSEPRAGWNVHVESRYPVETINRVMCERTVFVSQITSP